METTEKIELEPCASCRRAPEYLDSWELFRCGNVDCEDYDIRWASAPGWNVRQRKRLACRRADYIEGCRAADAVAYYEPFDVEASADAYLSQQPADVARDKDLMDPNYGCQERRDERLMEMAKMLDRKFR